jgi:hypothetical protein
MMSATAVKSAPSVTAGHEGEGSQPILHHRVARKLLSPADFFEKL